MPSTTSDDRTLERTCDWVLVGLVAVVLFLDGALAAAVFDPVAVALASVPVDYLRLGLAGLAVVVVLAGSVAAGLRSPPYAVVGLLGLPVAFVYGVTGLLLPWDQLSFWLAQALLDLTLAIPLVGEHVAGVLFGGVTLGRETLQRAFFVHYAIVGLAGIALLWSVARHRTPRIVRTQFS